MSDKKMRDIDTLKFDPANARKHDERNIKAIMDSLRMHGQRKPVVLYSDMIVAGNGTVAAAKRLGWTEVWVNNDPFESLEAAKAYALQDNRSAELAAWDDVQLCDTLTELKEAGWDLEQIGFDDSDLKDLIEKPQGTDGLTDADEVPEVGQNEYGVKRGDIWQLGSHRLMCGDSTESDDIEKLFEGSRADFCFTSPPYSDQRDYNGSKDLSTKKIAQFLKAPCDLFAVNLGMQRKDREVYPYWDDYITAAKDFGHKFLSWNIWNKGEAGSIGNQTAMFSIIHEWVFVFGKYKELNKTIENKTAGYLCDHRSIRQKDGKTKKSKESKINTHSQLRTIFDCTPQKARDDINHPARFPVEFAEGYIEACSSNGNIVYEPFTGSGSTLIACEKTGRKCYGMELDENYCSVIIKRWEDFTGKKAEKISEAA